MVDGEDKGAVKNGVGKLRISQPFGLFYWLNRRSQKKSYTWEAFNTMLKEYPLARPKIYVNIYR